MNNHFPVGYPGEYPECLSEYTFDACLKSGSVQVYKGRHNKSHKPVLLKMSRDPEIVDQLKNEYYFLTIPEYKNKGIYLPKVYLFQLDDQSPECCVFIREYLEGLSVEQLVDSQISCPGISEEEAVRILIGVLQQVQCMHRMNPPIIHRDIKPQNIIVDKQGIVYIIDFGISRLYSQDRTTDTRVLGTRVTAPPEQFGYRQTDQRSDLFSCGVLLRYCLTGEYEDKADAEISSEIRSVITKATQFDPENRYQSAAEMLADLHRIAGATAKVTEGDRRKRFFREKKHWLPAAVFLFVLLCVPFGVLGRAFLPAVGGRKADVQLEEYQFREPLLEMAARHVLNRPEGPLTRSDLLNVRSIRVYGKQIYDEEGQIDFLGPFVRMVDPELNAFGLWTENGQIASLEDLEAMPNLETLYLYNQQLSEIEALRGRNLSMIGIGNNPLTDLSPLSGMTSVQSLNLCNLLVGNLESLRELTGLKSLNISGTQVNDLGPVENLPIEQMNLFYIPLENYSRLTRMPALKEVTINKLTPELLLTFSDVSHLNTLTVTHANGVPLEDVQILQKLEHLYYYADSSYSVDADVRLNFPEMKWLDVKNIRLPSLQILSGLSNLETLLIYSSEIEDYSGLEELGKLKTIHCSANQTEKIRRLYPEKEWELFITE